MVGDLNIKYPLHRLNISHSVHERAYAAGAFHNIKIIVKVALFHELFQTSVYISYFRYCLNDLFILKDEIKMHRLRKNRMLRSERYYCSVSHYSSSSSSESSMSASGLNGVSASMV